MEAFHLLPDFDHTLHGPFALYISGPSQSGKSHLTMAILRRRHEIIFPKIQHIVYCYGINQPKVFKELKEQVGDITFHEGLPSEFGDGLGSPMLYVLDDLMHEVAKSKRAHELFTRESHHTNTSILCLVQNFFLPGLHTIVLSCKYFIIFKNPMDVKSAKFIGMRMTDGTKNDYFMDAFRQSTEKKHGYLFVDNSQTQNDKYRLRDDVFCDFGATVFIKK